MICCNHVTSVLPNGEEKNSGRGNNTRSNGNRGNNNRWNNNNNNNNAALTTIAVPEVALEDGGGTIAVTDSVTHKAHGLNLWVGDISNITQKNVYMPYVVYQCGNCC